MASFSELSISIMSPALSMPSMMSPPPPSFELSPRYRSLCLDTPPPFPLHDSFSHTYLHRRQSATPLPSHFDKRFSFFTGMNAEELLDLIQESLLQHAFDAEVDVSRWRVDASNAFVTLCVHVFEARHDDRRCVEFQLRQGDRGDFRALIVDVVDSMELLDLDPAEMPSALFGFSNDQFAHDCCAEDPLAMPSLTPSRGAATTPLSNSVLDALMPSLKSSYVDVQFEALNLLAKTVLRGGERAAIVLAQHRAALQAVVTGMDSTCEQVNVVSMSVAVSLVGQNQQEALLRAGAMDALLRVLDPRVTRHSQQTLRQALRCLTTVHGIDEHPSWSRIADFLKRLHVSSSASPSLRALIRTLMPNLKDMAMPIHYDSASSVPIPMYSRSL